MLVIGGGFAGGDVARGLAKAGATIVNPTNLMLYTPLRPRPRPEPSSHIAWSRSAPCALVRALGDWITSGLFRRDIAELSALNSIGAGEVHRAAVLEVSRP